jgi:hypothetical protein
MSAKPKEEAFQRHPRPQLPTKAALLLESRKPVEKLKASAPEKQTRTPTLYHESPWKSMSRLGELVQGNHQWHIGLLNGKLMMVRKMDLDAGRQHLKKVKPLAHPNIAKLEDLFEDDHSLYFRFEYSRFTLGEVLNVHLHFEEPHILAVAHSVCLPFTSLSSGYSSL